MQVFLNIFLWVGVFFNYEGHNAYEYGGHPAPSGRALPNLLMQSVFKNQSQKMCFDVDVDFNILTAFIRLGRARPEGAGCPP